jgi:hypothetical protein
VQALILLGNFPQNCAISAASQIGWAHPRETSMKSTAASQTQEVPTGLVERVTYHNPENGFYLLRAKARGHRDLVTIVAQWITATGDGSDDRTHGQQFKTRFLRAEPPTSSDGIEKFLASGMIRGIGPVYAKKPVPACSAGRRAATCYFRRGPTRTVLWYTAYCRKMRSANSHHCVRCGNRPARIASSRRRGDV